MAPAATVRHRAGPRRPPRLALALALTAAAAQLAQLAQLARLAQLPTGFVPGLAGRPAARGSRLPRASRGGEAAKGYAVGERVKARSPDDEQWYPGAIAAANADGSFTVKWDDPEGGPETEDLTPDALQKVFVAFKAGDDVLAMSHDDNKWYPGKVERANGDGSFHVRWDDPDGGPESTDTRPNEMKKVGFFKGYEVGNAVEAMFPEDGQMYPGTVTQVNADGTFQVTWDDPADGPEHSACTYKDMISRVELEVGQKYKGVIVSITDYGAFVDIGTEPHGLLHISRISREHVEAVRDVLEEGQEVDVWISGLRENGKFGVSMVEGLVDGGGLRAPSIRSWRDTPDLSAFCLPPTEWLTGVVKSMAPFGAFVSVTSPDGGSTGEGLLHIKQIKEGFVENIELELEIGQEVQIRVLSVDLAAGEMRLSMLPVFGSGGAQDVPAFQAVPPEQWLTGKVVKRLPFGAFVTVALESGAWARGLVHITEIKEGHVESAEAELELGQEVQVRVMSVDVEAGKLFLSMKPEA